MINPKKNKGTNKGHENLIPAKKGEVRNPNGRPPKIHCIPDILKKIGEETAIYKKKKFTKLDAVLYKVFEFALDGKPWAVQFIAERTEGKPIQPIEIDANVNQRISIEQRIKELSNKTPEEIIDELNQEILFDSKS